ncbi:MAG: hypothetical protein AMXMBFR58_13160 [Phycisphaerae bacterium]
MSADLVRRLARAGGEQRAYGPRPGMFIECPHQRPEGGTFDANVAVEQPEKIGLGPIQCGGDSRIETAAAPAVALQFHCPDGQAVRWDNGNWWGRPVVDADDFQIDITGSDVPARRGQVRQQRFEFIGALETGHDGSDQSDMWGGRPVQGG